MKNFSLGSLRNLTLVAAAALFPAVFMLLTCTKETPTGGGADTDPSVIDSSSQTITAADGGSISLTNGSSVGFPAGFFTGDRTVTLALLSAMPEQPPCGSVQGVGPCLEISGIGTALPVVKSVRKTSAVAAKVTDGEVDFTIEFGNATVSNLAGSLPVADIIDAAGNHTFAGIPGSLNSRTNPTAAVFRVKQALFTGASRIVVGMANLIPSWVGASSSPAPQIWNGSAWVAYPKGFDSTKKTLVLTHGIFSDVSSAYPCVKNIMQAGGYEQVIGFNYDWTQNEEATGASLAAFLDRLKAAGLSQIDLEAHSYGGLTVLSGAARSSLRINNIVLEGSPISGTPAAGVADSFVVPWLTTFMNSTLGGSLFPATAASLEAIGKSGFLTSLENGNTSRIPALVAAHPETRFIRVAGAIDSTKTSRANRLVFGGTANDGFVPATSLSAPTLPGPATKTFALGHTELECDTNVVKAVGTMLGSSSGSDSGSGGYTGTFTGVSTMTSSCGEIPHAEETFQLTPTFTVTISVSGNGTMIDPYTGSMTVSGRLGELTLLSCHCQDCDGELAETDIPFSGTGTVSGSQGTVEAVAAVPLGTGSATVVFTGGTRSGASLSGSFTFSWPSKWSAVEKSIVLKKK